MVYNFNKYGLGLIYLYVLILYFINQFITEGSTTLQGKMDDGREGWESPETAKDELGHFDLDLAIPQNAFLNVAVTSFPFSF